jgi:hypothetical protein
MRRLSELLPVRDAGVSDGALAIAEQRLGHRLPQDPRDFLRVSDGSRWAEFPQCGCQVLSLSELMSSWELPEEHRSGPPRLIDVAGLEIASAGGKSGSGSGAWRTPIAAMVRPAVGSRRGSGGTIPLRAMAADDPASRMSTLERLPDWRSGSPLVEASDLVADRATIAGWLGHVDRDWGAELKAAFGVTADEVDQAAKKVLDAATWPTLRVELQSGATIWVVERNYDEDAATDYYLDDPTWQAPIRLASLEGHYTGPAFAWEELQIALRAPRGALGVVDPSLRLVALLPALGDAAAANIAAPVVVEALARLGARNVRQTVAAQHLREGGWFSQTSWRSVAGVRTCDSQYSPRNPESSYALAHGELAVVSAALSNDPGLVP